MSSRPCPTTTTCRPSTHDLPRHERRRHRAERTFVADERGVSFAALAADIVVLPVIALFELRFGIANAARAAENERRLAIFFDTLPTLRILDFKARDAEEAGIIRADLKAQGHPPSAPTTVLIAAQARRRGAALVTANTREFARVPGLALQDWSAA